MTNFSSRPARTAALVVRMALGVFFIASAILKLVGIDEFEIYIFSFNLLKLNAAFLAARLIIVAEMLVGIGLLANVWNRFVNVCAMLMLVGFTLFLCYAVLAGRTDSCHCMGSLIEVNPTQSLLKNAVLVILLLVAAGSQPWRLRPRWWLWLPVVVAPFVAVFTISAPDNWLFGPADELYDADELGKAIAPTGDLGTMGLGEGRHVVAFLSPGCGFCRMADEKLTHICRRNQLDSTAFVYLLPAKDTVQGQPAIDTTAFIRPGFRIPMMTYFRITYGQRPMVFLLDGAAVRATCHYRNIDENQIVRFLRHEDE